MIKDSIKIGNIELHNRMVKAPIYSNTCANGQITADTIKHYDDRTKGGRFGLVYVEHTYVRKDGIAGPAQLSAADDADLEGLKRLADLIHNNGSKALLQLNHAGCGALRKDTGMDAVSASDISVSCGLPGSDPNPEKPHALTMNEVQAMEEAYVIAAELAMKTGYDGVNIHSAHGYFLNQFYSPISNKRIDAYNGYTIEGRCKIHCEIINGVRQAIGNDKIISLRLGACDYMSGGSTIEDGVAAALLFEKAGIDLMDVSGGLCSFVRPGHKEAGYFGDAAEAIRKALQIPVLLTGGVKTVADAEMLLQQGKADLIGTGRAITADANWGQELCIK